MTGPERTPLIAAIDVAATSLAHLLLRGAPTVLRISIAQTSRGWVGQVRSDFSGVSDRAAFVIQMAGDIAKLRWGAGLKSYARSQGPRLALAYCAGAYPRIGILHRLTGVSNGHDRQSRYDLFCDCWNCADDLVNSNWPRVVDLARIIAQTRAMSSQELERWGAATFAASSKGRVK